MSKLVIENSSRNRGTEVSTAFVSPHGMVSLHFANFHGEEEEKKKYYSFFTIDFPAESELQALGDFILSYVKQLRKVKKGF